MFVWLFSSIFFRVTLPSVLGIEDHSDDPLAPFPNDEGVSARGFIYPASGSLLSDHVVCHGKFNLVVVFVLVLYNTPVTI